MENFSINFRSSKSIHSSNVLSFTFQDIQWFANSWVLLECTYISTLGYNIHTTIDEIGYFLWWPNGWHFHMWPLFLNTLWWKFAINCSCYVIVAISRSPGRRNRGSHKSRSRDMPDRYAAASLVYPPLSLPPPRYVGLNLLFFYCH